MIEQNQINQIKAISIVDYLAVKGFHPSKTSGSEYVYFSPIRRESTPSFFVNPAKNVYKDFGKDGGDIIKLVMEMNNCDFIGAINILSGWQPAYTRKPVSENSIESNSTDPEITITKVKPVTHQALINYLAKRSVHFSFVAKYISEVHYTNKDRSFFSIGFQNDKGGWALRNERFKNCIGHQGYTYLKVPGSTKISVFEGFFDFLSALTYYRTAALRNSVLVLNSTSNLNSAKDLLSPYDTILMFLDNDDAGQKALETTKNWKFPIIDKSNLYQDYKDFSDFLSAGNRLSG